MPIIDPNRSVTTLDERLERETNPVFRHQLEEVRFHIATEVAGDIEPALARLSDKASYTMFDNINPPTTIEGVDAIRENFYKGIDAMMDVCLEFFITHLSVDDGAVITQGEQKCAMRGSYLASQGIDADPDAFYLSEQNHLVIWPFDEVGKLIGETIFFGYQTPLADVVKRPLTPEDRGKWAHGPVPLPSAG